MEGNRFIDLLREGKLSRRQVSAALAAVGLGMAAVPVFARRAGAADGIEYFSWAGYEEPDFHRAYTAEYGGEPRSGVFATAEEALQKMLAGYRPDVAHPCTDNMVRWRNAGVVKPIDVSRLRHYGDVWPELKTLAGVVADDQIFMVPFDWGNTSIIYRTDLVEIEEESWNLLFDERYAGKLSVQNSSDHAVTAAGLALGVKEVFAMTEDELARVKELLIRQKPLLRYYWDDASSMEQSLASGEIVASTGWNESVVRLTQQGVPIKYMNPKEGILTWVCGLSLIEGAAGDEAAAYDFIDAMLDPESGKFLIESWGYGHANRKSFDLADPKRLAELGIAAPAELFAQGRFFVEVEPALKQRYNAMFEEVKVT